jgi:hypothetical protein
MKHESGLTLNQLAERNANLVTEIEKCRELSGCPASVDLQDWVKQLAAESLQWQMSIPHRIVAGIKADGVEEYAKYISLYSSNSEQHAINFAKQLRKGADK